MKPPKSNKKNLLNGLKKNKLKKDAVIFLQLLEMTNRTDLKAKNIKQTFKELRKELNVS